MRVPDGAGGNARAQCAVPCFDVERPQHAQHLGTEVRRNLMFEQLPLAFRRARGNLAGGLPLVDAHAHEIGHRSLARLDVVALAGSSDKLGAFNLRLPLRTFEAVPFALALAALRVARLDDDGPMTGRAFAKVPSHLESSPLGGDSCLLLLSSAASSFLVTSSWACSASLTAFSIISS